jgi:hypothetical protein
LELSNRLVAQRRFSQCFAHSTSQFITDWFRVGKRITILVASAFVLVKPIFTAQTCSCIVAEHAVLAMAAATVALVVFARPQAHRPIVATFGIVVCFSESPTFAGLLFSGRFGCGG